MSWVQSFFDYGAKEMVIFGHIQFSHKNKWTQTCCLSPKGVLVSGLSLVFIGVCACVCLLPTCTHHTCIDNYIGIAVLLVLQHQKVTEPSAIFFYHCRQVCKLLQDPQVLQEETECVPTLVPVVGAVITAQPGQLPHRCVSIFSIIQVGSVWRTLLQREKL